MGLTAKYHRNDSAGCFELQIVRHDSFVGLGSANRGDMSDRRLDIERAEHNDFFFLVCLLAF